MRCLPSGPVRQRYATCAGPCCNAPARRTKADVEAEAYNNRADPDRDRSADRLRNRRLRKHLDA